jgi:RNase P subunit RPR2
MLPARPDDVVLAAAIGEIYCPKCEFSRLSCDVSNERGINHPDTTVYCRECGQHFRVPRIELKYAFVEEPANARS